MKNTFLILLLSSLLFLVWCWKKENLDTVDNLSQWWGNNEVISEDTKTQWKIITEKIIGEESIIPQYIDNNVTTDIWTTDERILFFYSEDSEKSKELDAILNSNDKPELYSDVIKIDFNEESEAKENYGIVEANSFVLVDETDTLVKKIENVWNIESILTLYE